MNWFRRPGRGSGDPDRDGHRPGVPGHGLPHQGAPDPDFSDPVFTDPNWGNDWGTEADPEFGAYAAEMRAFEEQEDRELQRDLARGRALALRMMDLFDAELAATEARVAERRAEAALGHLRTAAALRDEWRALPHPGDLFIRANDLALFTAALSQAHACLVPSAPPCLFDPYHGAATASAVWSPHPRALPRPVRCCADDAARLAAGNPPASREFPTLEGDLPSWACDDEVYAYWTLGHFTLTGTTRLEAELAGTPMGHTIARLTRYSAF